MNEPERVVHTALGEYLVFPLFFSLLTEAVPALIHTKILLLEVSSIDSYSFERSRDIYIYIYLHYLMLLYFVKLHDSKLIKIQNKHAENFILFFSSKLLEIWDP